MNHQHAKTPLLNMTNPCFSQQIRERFTNGEIPRFLKHWNLNHQDIMFSRFHSNNQIENVWHHYVYFNIHEWYCTLQSHVHVPIVRMSSRRFLLIFYKLVFHCHSISTSPNTRAVENWGIQLEEKDRNHINRCYKEITNVCKINAKPQKTFERFATSE